MAFATTRASHRLRRALEALPGMAAADKPFQTALTASRDKMVIEIDH